MVSKRLSGGTGPVEGQGLREEGQAVCWRGCKGGGAAADAPPSDCLPRATRGPYMKPHRRHHRPDTAAVAITTTITATTTIATTTT